MKYLCDTHIFLWWLTNDKQLKVSIKRTLSNPDNIVYASVVTAWEMIIKLKNDSKFRMSTTIKECFQKAGFQILEIQLTHVLQLQKLKYFHKDPFDRMLIAQAISEEATLITKDEKIRRYGIPILKA